MPYNSSEDCSYALYGGVAISYANTPTPLGMPFPHFHKDYELFLLVKGGRKFFSSNKICSLTPASAMLIEPGEHHQSTVNINCPMERYAVYISPKLIETVLKENRCFPALESIMRFETDPDAFAEIIGHINAIEKDIRLKDAYSKVDIKNHLTAVLISLFRNNRESEGGSSHFEKNDMRLQAPIDFILKNYSSQITLEQCADIAYMSVSHFSRQFHLITGMNFKEYLNRVRIEKACEILKKERVPNKTELAQAVGFSSGSYFTYVFRSNTGLSPTEYQKKYLQSKSTAV